MSSNSFFLAYGSSATRAFSPQQLVDLLGISRANNERDGITGMLLHRGGNFLQALEGPEAAVRKTMDRITRDDRHGSVVPLIEEWPEARLFADWSMAFEDVSRLDPSKHPGMSNYLALPEERSPVSNDGDHDVFEFFRSFREHIR